LSDSASTPPRLDAARILEVLVRHGVEFVVIGQYAAELRGALLERRTQDIDLTPAIDQDNLARLSTALDELGAHIRTEGVAGGLPFSHDARSLARSAIWNLTCRWGEFDLSFNPSGTSGYHDLVTDSKALTVGGVEVFVASLEGVIRSKEAAGRPKDVRVLPALRAIAERLRTERPDPRQ
jgi:hypothetical protein